MAPMRRTAATVLVSALFALAGCKGPCRQLSEKLCECTTTTSEKELCLQRVSNEQNRFEPTAEEEAVCEGLVDKCDCHTIDTDEGKRNCGLAN